MAVAGHLEQGGQVLEPPIAEEGREAFADQTLLEVGVAVAVRSERCRRVVDV
jgi:hypothetical protein